jgi:hypothetical protein
MKKSPKLFLTEFRITPLETGYYRAEVRTATSGYVNITPLPWTPKVFNDFALAMDHHVDGNGMEYKLLANGVHRYTAFE